MLKIKGSQETGFTISTYGWDKCDDQCSLALTSIGEFLFFKGRVKEAFKLWDRVPNQFAVEDAILSLCELLLDKFPEQASVVEELLYLMEDKKRKAHILLSLSHQNIV